MLLFGATCLLALAPFVHVQFFGNALTAMLIYVWGRRNEHVLMSFLGLFTFRAPFLPWVLVAFSLLLGHSAQLDLLGIAVGHVYLYLKDVLPTIGEFRGWGRRDFLPTPRILCGGPSHPAHTHTHTHRTHPRPPQNRRSLLMCEERNV